MNSITHDQSGLAHPALRPAHAGLRPAFLADYRLHNLRQIIRDAAMLVAVLAFVATFVALRMTLFASPELTERVAIPVAAGAAVVFVLALLTSFALRGYDAPGSSQST